MLELLPAPDTVVAMRVTGRVDDSDIERGIQAIEAALAGEEHISLLAEIEMSGMTAGALAKDLSYSLGKLRDLHRFRRIAVVTSQEWMHTIAQVQDRILPHVQVRAFGPSERDEAMAWVLQPLDRAERDGTESAPEPSPAVRLIRTTRQDVVAFEVNGKITSADMGQLITVFDEAMKAHERIRVLVRARDFDGVTFEALRNEALWSVKMRGLKQVERYALVVGQTGRRRLRDGSRLRFGSKPATLPRTRRSELGTGSKPSRSRSRALPRHSVFAVGDLADVAVVNRAAP